jgi:hypothetical protein
MMQVYGYTPVGGEGEFIDEQADAPAQAPDERVLQDALVHAL